ncbi:hypothetical protein BaRGS_00016210 [Batillaria attramentaria]|uniref:Cytosolic fatty-acid binding proteins domain-containing protein n=1 Tax=Batillaria attramentaria TaxID=370345 RepID=A0ABD0KZE0_9CAEN
MAEGATEEIKKKFSGRWKVDRSENFDEFMAAMGMNFLLRKMAGFSKPENVLQVDDDGTISIATSSTFMKNEQRFKLNEEFEEINHFTKKKFKNMPIYENGKLRITPTPAELWILLTQNMQSASSQKTERFFCVCITELLALQTIKVGDVLCKRYFKRVET